MSELVSACDVSDSQPADLGGIISAHQLQHVVVKLYTSAEIDHTQRSRDQLASAQANGCTVGGYVFLYRGVDTAQQARDGIALARSCGVELPILWIDVEEYQGVAPTPSEVSAAVNAAGAEGVPVGIYTGDWVIQKHYGGHAGFMAEYPLWLADWNHVPDLNVHSAYWPDAMIYGHQYSADGIDLDVFDASVTVPASTPTPPTDCEWAMSSLGYASHDLADGYTSEANRKGGPRKSQILALTEQLRALSPT